MQQPGLGGAFGQQGVMGGPPRAPFPGMQPGGGVFGVPQQQLLSFGAQQGAFGMQGGFGAPQRSAGPQQSGFGGSDPFGSSTGGFGGSSDPFGTSSSVFAQVHTHSSAAILLVAKHMYHCVSIIWHLLTTLKHHSHGVMCLLSSKVG